MELQLGGLLELFALGMAEPLPLYCKTSAAWAAAAARHRCRSGRRAGRREWESAFDTTRTRTTIATRLVLGWRPHVQRHGPRSGVPATTRPVGRPPEPPGSASTPRRLWDGYSLRAVTRRTAATGEPRPSRRPTEPFDVCGPLPSGMTLLEASAGTGKTFTIAALTTRYIAERAARSTGSWSSPSPAWRRGSSASGCVSGWSAPSTGWPPYWPAHRPDRRRDRGSAGRRPDARTERHDRLAKAIADFDAATIETTHGFCLQVLYGLGTAGDIDRDVTLVEDVRDLLEEVVDDLYLRKFASRPNPHDFTHAQALEIAGGARPPRRRDRARPVGGRSTSTAIRRRFAAIRKEMDRRKRALKIMTYDDVLLRLRDTLRDPRADHKHVPASASATTSCWSTNSRTPTPCNGRS